MFIIEHIPITKTHPNIYFILLHSLTKLRDFYVIGYAYWEGYKCSLNIRSRGAMRNT
jgi:hypothetical protein